MRYRPGLREGGRPWTCLIMQPEAVKVPDGVIRAARPADARPIAAVHVATWRHAYAGLLPDEVLAGLDVDERAQRWNRNLAASVEGRFVLVFEQDGRVGGFVSGGPSRDQFPGGEVYAIYVDPARQGRGAGRRLLTAAVRHLAEAQFTDASLWVLADNRAARGFYESQGWRSDGTEQPWTHAGGHAVMEVRYVMSLAALGAQRPVEQSPVESRPGDSMAARPVSSGCRARGRIPGPVSR
jgi:ribosomal protein S18 acetylase RimI-like enzyme